ncbi:MAG TPA: TolC family protein, partial [Terriglobales bacterium]|nr:TolC family protein [Terriglobales bacterium]
MKLAQVLPGSPKTTAGVRFVLTTAAIVSLIGCAVGPKYKTPTVPVPPAYKEVANWKAAQPSEQNLGGNWWEIFNDPQLNALEQQINVSNQNLKQAIAQYQQARAALRNSRADYYPTVTTSPSATRERFSANRPGSIARGATFNDFVMPVDVSYQANVWGRVSRSVESSREQAQASAADL